MCWRAAWSPGCRAMTRAWGMSVGTRTRTTSSAALWVLLMQTLQPWIRRIKAWDVTFDQKSKKNCKRFCYENWSRLLRVLLVRMKWWRFLIPLLMLCLSTVGWSGSNVGAQTDPSSRGGEREGERLTSGERPLGRRKKKQRNMMSEDATSPQKGQGWPWQWETISSKGLGQT